MNKVTRGTDTKPCDNNTGGIIGVNINIWCLQVAKGCLELRSSPSVLPETLLIPESTDTLPHKGAEDATLAVGGPCVEFSCQ